MTIAGVQERAQLLLQKIGSESFTPEQAVKEFSKAEIKEAKVVCFEGRYLPAHFAMRALEALNAVEREWLDVASSRPAAQAVVEIRYLQEGDSSPRRGPGFWNPHVTKGNVWYLMQTFGWQPVQALSWRPFDEGEPS